MRQNLKAISRAVCLAPVLLFASCIDIFFDTDIPASFEYHVIENARINKSFWPSDTGSPVLRWPTICKGNYRVFRFKYRAPQTSSSSKYLVEKMCFQIPMSQDSFVLRDAQICSAKCHYEIECYCGTDGVYTVLEGTISGHKKSATTWKIVANIAMDIPDRDADSTWHRAITIDHQFEEYSQWLYTCPDYRVYLYKPIPSDTTVYLGHTESDTLEVEFYDRDTTLAVYHGTYWRLAQQDTTHLIYSRAQAVGPSKTFWFYVMDHENVNTLLPFDNPVTGQQCSLWVKF